MMSHATILLSAQQHLATLGYPGSPIKTAEVRKLLFRGCLGIHQNQQDKHETVHNSYCFGSERL